MKQIKIIVIGAGSRGNCYSQYTKVFPEQARIVGVAEPRKYYREKFAGEYDIPLENTFEDWTQLAKKNKFADAVIIATQDDLHTEPAIAFSKMGYHILLEKPMASTEHQIGRAHV